MTDISTTLNKNHEEIKTKFHFSLESNNQSRDMTYKKNQKCIHICTDKIVNTDQSFLIAPHETKYIYLCNDSISNHSINDNNCKLIPLHDDTCYVYCKLYNQNSHTPVRIPFGACLEDIMNNKWILITSCCSNQHAL